MEVNKIYCGDSRNMDKVDSDSIHLTVTSPPYYVGKDYEDYIKTLDDYFQMLYDVFAEVTRVTIPGGKVCINLGDIAVGSRYNEGFPEEILIMPKLVDYLQSIGVYLYARIIWEKDDPWANSSHVSFHKKIQHAEYRILPAWEYVFVFRKGKQARKDNNVTKDRYITKSDWKKLVHGVWKIRSVARNDMHEAMFPEELVYNCVQLYSFPNDIVLDPFSGSGTTSAVSKKSGRNYIGYELDEHYATISLKRLDEIERTDPADIKPFRDKTVNAELQTGLGF